MGRAIQAKVNRLKSKKLAGKIINEINWYINEYHELEKEHTRIQSWRIIKQLRNIQKREKLTREFKIRMFELGVFI